MSGEQDKYVLTLHSNTKELCDRWERSSTNKCILKTKLREELPRKKQLIIDANPDFASNSLALINKPKVAAEKANIEVRENGDFYFVGTHDYKPMRRKPDLLQTCTIRITPDYESFSEKASPRRRRKGNEQVRLEPFKFA